MKIWNEEVDNFDQKKQVTINFLSYMYHYSHLMLLYQLYLYY